MPRVRSGYPQEYGASLRVGAGGIGVHVRPRPPQDVRVPRPIRAP